MTPWQWWATSEEAHSDGEWSVGEFDTKEEAMSAANREYPRGTRCFVIEARSSSDAKYYDGSHELIPFLRTRNKESFVTGLRIAA